MPQARSRLRRRQHASLRSPCPGWQGFAHRRRPLKLVTLASTDDALLEELHRGIYWAEFSAQHEPLDVWKRALRGELPYELTIRAAFEGEAIAGAIAYERYPRSGCGLVTYLVVAPTARRKGLGRMLLTEATQMLLDAGAPLVLGEVSDPTMHGEDASIRLARFQRWGARVLGVRYIQPALSPELGRDRGLVLIAFAGETPLPDAISGGVVQAFVKELYDVTEHRPPDETIAIPEVVQLHGLS